MVVEQNSKLQEERVQYQLQVQADQIQKVLNHHGSPATISGGGVDNRMYSFDLRSSLASGLEKLSFLKNEFKKALGVESIWFNRNGGQLQLQVVRPVDPAVPLLDLLSNLTPIAPSTAVLGLAEDGSIITHEFSAESAPNILIYGDKNSGKTNLLRTIAASLVFANRQADIQLVAINPTAADSERREEQKINWRPLNYLPHLLTDVVTRQSEITELLLFLVREMHYRSENSFSSPRIVVLIDQAATVLERGGRTVNEAVLKIAEQGAESGIHVVLATRRPQTKNFGPHLMTNLQARFVGYMSQDSDSNPDYRLGLRAATLLGEGDFLAGGLAGPSRFQAAYINDYDLHMGLSKLYRSRPILLAQPKSIRTQLNKGTTQSDNRKSFSVVEGAVSVS